MSTVKAVAVKAVKKAAVVTVAPINELRVWCEQCSIRIAPNEDRTVTRGKIYHPRCHSKLFPHSSKLKS